MMEYLKNHILDEIDGAIEYMEKAIEFKGTEWGSKFRKMSEMEAEHANCLTKMFNNMKKPENVSDAQYAEMSHQILDKYSSSMGKLEAMKRLYWE